jgi:hypothetical protein
VKLANTNKTTNVIFNHETFKNIITNAKLLHTTMTMKYVQPFFWLVVNFAQCLLKDYVQIRLSFAFECFFNFITMTNVNLTKLKKTYFLLEQRKNDK